LFDYILYAQIDKLKFEVTEIIKLITIVLFHPLKVYVCFLNIRWFLYVHHSNLPALYWNRWDLKTVCVFDAFRIFFTSDIFFLMLKWR